MAESETRPAVTARPWSGKPTLSVLCPTWQSGPMVASLLEPLREISDEIVIAADSRVSEEDLGAYASVADVLWRHEFAGADKQWPWFAAQARGDWILILDGDELISDQFLAALPELMADRRISQYLAAIHWAWRDPATPSAPLKVLQDEPWRSDRRLRLLRNDGRLAFAGKLHHLAQAAPPVAFRDDLAVYHLDLLLPDQERRRKKAERYEAERFGTLTPEGLPFNQALYLPEARSEPLNTRAIPPADAARIERALQASLTTGPRLPAESVALTDRATQLRAVPGAEIELPGQNADLTITQLPSFTAERRDNIVWLELTHRGTVDWHGTFGPGAQLEVLAAWRPTAGGAIQEVGRTPLPHALSPGQSLVVPVHVASPSLRGQADLVLGLAAQGSRAVRCEIVTRIDVLPTAAALLANAAEHNGGVLTLGAAQEVRRQIGRRDGLHPDGEPGAPAEPQPCSATLDHLIRTIREQRPQAIVEFGAGASTLLIAQLLNEAGRAGNHLVSFCDDPTQAGAAATELKAAGLDRWATVLHVPLGAPEPSQQAGYSLTGPAVAALRAHPPELAFINGPSLASGATRLHIPELLTPFTKGATTLLLNDALRDAELSIGAAWAQRSNLTVERLYPTTTGLLEVTLQTPPRGVKGIVTRRRARRLAA